MEQTTGRLLDFLGKSPSCYHAVENLAALLRSAGYQELTEGARWALQPGGRYLTRRNGSSLVAFALPEGESRGFQIAAAHSDFPCLKLKAQAEMLVEKSYTVLNVEKYGGLLLAPWLDRPLSIAGRVTLRRENRFETRLVHLDRDLLLIPNLAIHMNRKANEGYAYDPQKDMLPLFGEASAKGRLMELVAENVAARPEEILGADLFLYNRTPGAVWGAGEEFFSSPRIDDLQCAWGITQGLLAGKPGKAVNVCAVFDNEEVGSVTKQGAASTLLADTLERISLALGRGREEHLAALSASFMVSADNAHALHPNRTEVADPVNRPKLNGGIVLKHNANQHYTTDAVSAALFQALCDDVEVPVQIFTNRSDVVGGSTLGNVSSQQVSVNCVDIGLAQLAMHSPYETGGCRDTERLIRVMERFYSVAFLPQGDGGYVMSEA